MTHVFNRLRNRTEANWEFGAALVRNDQSRANGHEPFPSGQPCTMPDIRLDPAILCDLQASDDGALLARAMDRLAQQIAGARTDLPAHLALGDIAGAQRFARRLANTCDVLGARELAEHLNAFAIIAETATLAALRALLDEMMPVLEATVIAVARTARAAVAGRH